MLQAVNTFGFVDEFDEDNLELIVQRRVDQKFHEMKMAILL